MNILKIIWLIWRERKYQNKIWGKDHDRTHTPIEWAEILDKYVEKYNQAEDWKEDRRRLIQIAVICVAILETK